MKGYETVLHEKGYSAPVLYNLANAYFLEGQIGRAILNYNRAQLLAPDDPDIAANLNFARRQAGLFTEQQSWVKQASCYLSMNEWSWLGSMGLFAACALIVAMRVYPAQRSYLGLLTGIAMVALLVAGVAIVTQSDTLHRAVVTEKDAVARISPFESARSAYFLSMGEEVTVEKTPWWISICRKSGAPPRLDQQAAARAGCSLQVGEFCCSWRSEEMPGHPEAGEER